MKKVAHIDQPLALPAIAKWAMGFSHFAFYVESENDFMAAIGAHDFIDLRETTDAFKALEEFQAKSQKRIAGYLGYDLKNDLEDLKSENPDFLQSPEAVFFEPQMWVSFEKGMLEIDSESEELIEQLLATLDDFTESGGVDTIFELRPQTSREAYLATAQKIKSHLQRGDIYEANYCVQFLGEGEGFAPVEYFLALQRRTKAPFSVFSKLGDFFVLSASPERFLKNTDGKLLSQPIKGTKRRSTDAAEDKMLIQELLSDQKELSENVMIVDLVRNDLSRIAKRGTVRVDELFGVQSFQTVHHLVSSISAEIDDSKFNHWDTIKACFPMGSMTGAPKISAMNIIETQETFKRSAYSGAFGWMDPNGDFDFNVLIRTLFYNADAERLALSVGSAITISAEPEQEYAECILKADAILDVLKPKTQMDETA